jgi:hypothetical protein
MRDRTTGQTRTYRELCTGEARRRIMGWRTGIWGLKRDRRNTEQGFVPYVTKKKTGATY